MKIAVVTLFDNNNFGNRLQNYATVQFLRNMGYDAETLVVKRKISAKVCVKNLLKKIACSLKIYSSATYLREKTFKHFTKTYIPTKYFKTKTFPSSLNNDYDYFAVGSDQVWNPTFGIYEDKYFNMFLMFAEPSKKICISPSIGISKIPERWISKFTYGFNTFPYLSVREETGAEIIRNLTGKDVEVLPDPTFMLDKNEWEKIVKPIESLKDKPYVLNYFLGDIDEEQIKINEEFCEQNGLINVNLLDPSNKEIYQSGPGEFLYLISHAKKVLTDSFHACVFSLIFGTPFQILKRKGPTQDMYSRIETLFSLFNISQDNFNKSNPLILDRTYVESIINIQKEKMKNFIKKSIQS